MNWRKKKKINVQQSFDPDIITNNHFQMKTNTIYDEDSPDGYERQICAQLGETSETRIFLIKENEQYFQLEVFKDNDEDTKKLYFDKYNQLSKLTCVGFNCIFDHFVDKINDDDHFFIKSDFVPGLTLYHILRYCKNEKYYHLSIKKYYKFKIILGIIKILIELHSAGHTYQYLHPYNIIIDSDFCPHLRSINFEPRVTGQNSHFYNFYPPKYFNSKELTPESDVFMLGGIIFNIITNRWPYSECDYRLIDNRLNSENYDFPKENEILSEDEPFIQIIKSYCWKYHPEDRIKLNHLGAMILEGAENIFSLHHFYQLRFIDNIKLNIYPKECYSGTQKNIDKEIRNGFAAISKIKASSERHSDIIPDIMDTIVKNHLHNEGAVDKSLSEQIFCDKYIDKTTRKYQTDESQL